MIEILSLRDRFIGGNGVGRVHVDFEIINNDDLVLERLGKLKPNQVRRLKTTGLVDPGATRLVVPQVLARQLGLKATGQVTVRYADERRAERDTVDGVAIEVAGRRGVYSAVVEPRRRMVLLGAIVLEDLDLLVDCKNERIIPRDPHHQIYEIE
jgi:predicted aspartyl protease